MNNATPNPGSSSAPAANRDQSDILPILAERAEMPPVVVAPEDDGRANVSFIRATLPTAYVRGIRFVRRAD